MFDSELLPYLIEVFNDPKSENFDIKGKFYFFPLQSEIIKLVNVLHSLIFMKMEGSKFIALGKIKLLIYQVGNYRFYRLNIKLIQTVMGDVSKIVVGTGNFILYIMHLNVMAVPGKLRI